MKRKNISSVLLVVILFSLCSVSSVFAQQSNLLPLGAPCERDPQCASDDCENAQDGKAYCDCGEDNDCVEQFKPLQPGEVWSCVNGTPETNDLDMCISNIQGRSQSTGPTEKEKLLEGDEIKKLTSKPALKINIPGLKFTDPQVVEDETGSVYLDIPLVGQYIKAIYRYGIVAAGIVAVVLIINAGFLWIRSAGNSEVIQQQKQSIEKAVIGLIIAVASYTILYTINPKLTQFESLKVQYVKGEEIAEYLSHAETELESNDLGGAGSSASYTGGEAWTIPGTNETVSLSAKDVCYFNTFGRTQAELNANISSACFLGSCIKVHKLIAPSLQQKFNIIQQSKDPAIVEWIKHLQDPTKHLQGKGKSFDPVTASGAFMPGGHGSDVKFVKAYGSQFNIEAGGGGIANTAKANLLKKKLAEQGTGSYKDKNGVTRNTKIPKTWVANGKHAWGLSFDIDYPHNGYGATPNIPQAAADILESGGDFIWGKRFKDPAHFEYSGPLCK